jgi:anti-sigma-K factor RskA
MIHNATAFEYVAGTLTGDERSAVEQLQVEDPELQEHIRFWEDQLMGLQNYQVQRQPADDVWEKILRRISIRSTDREAPLRPHYLTWRWFVSAALALALLVVLLIPNPTPQAPRLQADYVAVLTTPEGRPLLTVLTAGDDKVMQLKWEIAELPAHSSVQLWAVSRRDGMVRSLGVFETPGTQVQSISAADWRLIQDAEALLLTEEEPGGSALDQPSDSILAQGICVRLGEA